MKKAIVITLGVIIGVPGVLAICAHLADAARLALYVPEDDDDEDIYCSARIPCPASAAGGSGSLLCADTGARCADGSHWSRPHGYWKKRVGVLAYMASARTGGTEHAGVQSGTPAGR